jgi:hypothetical protein
MTGDLLNLLIVTINGRMRECKDKLEIEEKSKEVAFLQGNITGYKNLISYLCSEFNFTQVTVEDNGEDAPKLPECSDAYINSLIEGLETLEEMESWKRVMARISESANGLKNFLLCDAGNARDLYLSQAQWRGLTIYQDVFESVKNEYKRRSEELPFEVSSKDDESYEDKPEIFDELQIIERSEDLRDEEQS